MRLAGWLLPLCAVWLTGCAVFKRDAKKTDAPPPPAIELAVEAPGDLKALLANNLDIGRLRSEANGEPIGEDELKRLEAATPAEARALLETEGYFSADVTVQRQPSTGERPRVQIQVQPGPRSVVARADVQVTGALAAAADAGDAAAQKEREALQKSWPLQPGQPFRNPAWASAKTSTLAQLRAAGYASADWRETQAQVDAQNHAVTLTLVADSGPLYRTGELRVQGLDKQDEATVRNLANFPPGTPATEALLLDYQERLTKSGLFASAAVTIEPDPANAGASPVTVRVREQQLQQATFGVGASADTGARISVEHFHRRVFGLPATARNKFELGQQRQAWDGELSTQTLPGLHRWLIGGTYERLVSDTDNVTSARVRLGRSQETQRIDRFPYLQIEQAIVRPTADDAMQPKESAKAISANFDATWRDVDSILLPTRGQSLSIQTAIGQASSNIAPTGPYGRGYFRVQAWRPLGGNWSAYGRLEMGQVFVNNGVVVPDTQRFRAGGDESVRGYDYRSLGPTTNGVVGSGNMLFTTSVELAHPIVASLPMILGAVFIDAGNAADSWGDLKPVVGAGFGVRVRSPIGPLKVDLAYGEAVKNWRLHFSVGVTF